MLFVDVKMAPYSQRYLVVGLVGLVQLIYLVGLALWLGSGLAAG